MTAYYNENDPKAAAWLRELIRCGHIAAGTVDERSIEDVTLADLAGYTQCHFFAGIGGWSYALRLADWPDDKPVWTGSCPCQPFSAAGKRAGIADERHLWPAWFHFIAKCRPSIIFGEQVASKNGLAWFDIVQSDLEGASYTTGAADLCAAGVGAPHIRQRLYFVADARYRYELDGRQLARATRETQEEIRDQWLWLDDRNGGESSELANAERKNGRHAVRPASGLAAAAARTSNESRRYGDSWDCVQLSCIDGKSRPIEPGTFPLAHGIPNRVGLLRGYGNAIVPQVAQAFIESYLETVY